MFILYFSDKSENSDNDVTNLENDGMSANSSTVMIDIYSCHNLSPACSVMCYGNFRVWEMAQSENSCSAL